jgi:tripartite-type tricarboxylate transporter receptor subunit TctC
VKFLLLALCLGCTAVASAHAQTSFPTKPIRIVSPYPPGGPPDLLSRLLAPKLSEVLGQPVIVENKPGAGGDIGVSFVAKSAPDGYTLLLASNANVSSAATKKRPSFNLLADFKPVAMIGLQPMYLVATADLPANNIPELVRLAKVTPQGLNYATAGIGTPQHLAVEQINASQQIKLVHIPLQGAAQSLNETAAGRSAVAISGPLAAGALIAAKRLKVIAVGAPTRVAALPDVPTFAEAGVPGLESGFWFGVTLPAATSEDVIEKLTNAFVKVLEMPDTKAQLEKVGINPKMLAGPPFGEFIGTDLRRWKRIAAERSIEMD